MNDATEAIEMKKYKLFEIFAPWPLFGLYELRWPLLYIGWSRLIPPPSSGSALS